jgi:hypothetical protein
MIRPEPVLVRPAGFTASVLRITPEMVAVTPDAVAFERMVRVAPLRSILFWKVRAEFAWADEACSTRALGLKVAVPQTTSLAALFPKITLSPVAPLQLKPLSPPVSCICPVPEPRPRMKFVAQ